MFKLPNLPNVACWSNLVAMSDETCFPNRPLTAHEVRAVSVRAVCSPETVKRWLRREPLRGVSLERIEKAARILGLLDKEAV